MNPVTLKHGPLVAEFLPEMGMTLKSYRLNDLEVMAESTLEEFYNSRAGVGVLIGPHFLSRKQGPNPDPYLHGIARYAPWKYEATASTIQATLSGKDLLDGKTLSSLEGQNFTLRYFATLDEAGLKIQLSIVSDTDSLVGAHFYYHLPQGQGIVTSKVQPVYLDQGEPHTIPDEWLEGKHQLKFDLSHECDYTFHPYPDPLNGKITLTTSGYDLHLHYSSASEENCWQLWHPKGSRFICMEPMSAQNPRYPNLTVSSLQLTIKIDKK
jgi:galactose mutarotase-like enzyme